MKRWIVAYLVLLSSLTAHAAEETVEFGRFGTVTLYSESPRPSHVALFISGDGGWNLGVVEMAKSLAALDTLVVGIDIRHYLKQLEASEDKCGYPAADFEALSKFVQKTRGFPTYILPVLIGYSSGATLVYATLAQSPPNTFRGGVSMGFCPDLPLTKPLCRGSGLGFEPGPKGKGYSFLANPTLATPWIAFQGSIDQVCDPKSVQDFVSRTGQSEVVLLSKVGHGFSVEQNWLPQLKNSFTKLVNAVQTEIRQTDELKDLPLVEVPASKGESDTLAVIISGDGGWTSIDRELGNALATTGMAVVGLNSLQYFWKKRTAESSAEDLQKIIRHYLAAWNKSKVIVIGYSFGADVLPFMVNRLPEDMLSKISLAVLLGPSSYAGFEFHVTDWLDIVLPKSAKPVLPEVEKLRGMKILCVHGEAEKDTLCKKLDPAQAKVLATKGAHHFGGDYNLIAQAILLEAK